MTPWGVDRSHSPSPLAAGGSDRPPAYTRRLGLDTRARRTMAGAPPGPYLRSTASVGWGGAAGDGGGTTRTADR